MYFVWLFFVLSDNRDQDFDPTADLMKHEGYDDERTMEEEEAMSGGSCSNELDELQKVGPGIVSLLVDVIFIFSPKSPHPTFIL